ncbi:MAG: lamin tail domain-containing protein, partial [Verrucomicrobia bacterium]|nr:lamin tail domain-containing protein [Verrucomicrobiota bacterium]
DIAPGARTYNGPITVNGNVRIVARARNPQHTARTGPDNPPLRSIWSGVVAETFVVTPIPLRITEVMYHPEGDGPESDLQEEDFEFLELENTGDAPVDLAGFALEGTVDFAFTANTPSRVVPSGGRLLLVGNTNAFASRYPGIGPVAGAFNGSLNNDSGRLALFGRLREPVFDFRYAQEWSAEADGTGPSLALREEAPGPLPPGDVASWRASSAWGGSPGEADPAPVRLDSVLVEGVLRIRLTGTPGRSYGLQERAELATGGWRTADTRVAGPDGAVEFTIVPAAGMRLYRALLP